MSRHACKPTHTSNGHGLIDLMNKIAAMGSCGAPRRKAILVQQFTNLNHLLTPEQRQLKLLSQNLQKAPLAWVNLAITVDELAGKGVSGPALLLAE